MQNHLKSLTSIQMNTWMRLGDGGGESCYIIYFQSVNSVSQRPGEGKLVLGREVLNHQTNKRAVLK